jgi:hypothetical protein
MFITRVTKVVNPHHAHAHRSASVAESGGSSYSSNPAAHMLTLGFINPKGRVSMAKHKASRPRHASAKGHHHKSHNPHRKRKNPMFLGSNVKPMKMVELVAGGVVGLGVNNLALAALPATLTGNAFGAVAASIAIAIASGYAGSFIDKEFGAAVAFGGFMASAQIAINQWIPSVGSTIGLSGRGTGDFVGGKVVPGGLLSSGITMNGGNSMGGGVTSAYPAPYAIAA